MSGSKHHLRSGQGAALGAHRCHRELKRSVSICCSYVGGNMCKSWSCVVVRFIFVLLLVLLLSS